MTLNLTQAEADALYGMAMAGQDEWADTISRAADLSPQKRTAELAAGERALQKLRDA